MSTKHKADKDMTILTAAISAKAANRGLLKVLFSLETFVASSKAL